MYGKIFAQMYDGSLRDNWEAMVVFQQLIVLADKHGAVDMTANAISARTNLPLEMINQALHFLLEPDPQSRSTNEAGRRIVALEEHRDWGWRVVNYEHYCAIKNHEDLREQAKIRKRNQRARDAEERSTKGEDGAESPGVTQGHDPSQHGDVAGEKDTSSVDEERGASACGKALSGIDQFVITPDLRLWAQNETPSVDIDEETRKFKLHRKPRSNISKDLDAEWKLWMIRGMEYNGRKGIDGKSPAASSDDPYTNQMIVTLAKDLNIQRDMFKTEADFRKRVIEINEHRLKAMNESSD